ncbi:MAG: hypothetical protein LBU34_17390 [Planctomycetaceae bacterium]|jgi:DNA-directed RNA polymerase subunit RPC12/RpoP|nr:hypothetical protein [Planctomycetaceae bacterium]
MFTIQCTTCNAKLIVKNEELIGQIFACPKCGSMVLVQQPDEIAVSPPFKKFPDILTSETASGIINPTPEHSEKPLPPVLPSPPPNTLSDSELQTRKILLSVLAVLFLILITAAGVLMMVQGNRLNQIPTEQSDIPIDGSKTPEPSPDPAIPAEVVAPQKNIPKNITENAADSITDSIIDSIIENTIDNAVGSITENTPTNISEKLPETATPATTEKVPSVTPVTPANDTTVAGVTVETEENESNRLAELLAQTPKEPQPEIRSTTDLLSDIEKKMPGLIQPSPILSIDITARLAVPLTGLKLDNTPLFYAVRLLSDLTEIPITFDIDEMRPRGIRVDVPLTAQFDTGTVSEILTKILANYELEPVVEDRQILITVSPERRNTPSERTFDIADLVENTKNTPEPLTPEHLAEILKRLVDPANDSFIRIAGNSLTVQSRFRLLDETLRVLEQLRVIRNLPQQTEVVEKFLAPEAFGWDMVMTPMTLNYYQPTTLSHILSQLESAAKLHILVDHKALHRMLSPLQPMKATVQCNRGTVHEALEKLLASVDGAPLTYRIVDYDTLEITTTDSARQPEKMSIEVHRFVTATGETQEELVRTIRSALEPDSWRLPDDPETVGRGDIIIDRVSGCLLIRQSQPVQRQIRLWLGNKQSQEEESPE